MREIKNFKGNKRSDKSFFLEKMYNSRNEIITPDIINRNLKFLYRDIARGNVSDPKFEEALRGDKKILELAIDNLGFELGKLNVILTAIKIADTKLYTEVMNNSLVIETFNDVNVKFNMHSIMYNSIINFMSTGDFNHIRGVGITFGNNSYRKYRAVFN